MQVLMPKVLLETVTQEFFAILVGISQPKVSQLLTEGVLSRDASAHTWLLEYTARLREQASGRTSGGVMSQAEENAALLRSRREAQDMKNAVARGEFAPVALLAEVLAACGASVASVLDTIEGQVRKQVPDLPEPAMQSILTTVARARNTAISETARLVRTELAAFEEVPDEAVEEGAN